MNTPTKSGFTATLQPSQGSPSTAGNGYHHDFVVTLLPSQPPTVNLRVLTRYDHARDPDHRRELLNLSLDAAQIDQIVQVLRQARNLI